MVNMKKIFYVVSLSAVCMLCMLGAGCPQKYAVLISTHNVTQDDKTYHSVWWYDLFLQYKMLRENGFKDQNIYVLYGEGTDFNTKYDNYNAIKVYGHTITDSPNHKSDIQNIFSTLSTKVDGDDFLYVWWMGHGGSYAPNWCDLTMSISNTGEYVTDVEFATYLNTITSYNKRWVNIMTCHSGGMIDNLNVSGTKTVTFTSSACNYSSYQGPSCDVFHADFNYDEPSAMRKKDPCDTPVGSDSNGNGSIDLEEAFDYIKANMTTSTPQKADPDNIASSTVIN